MSETFGQWAILELMGHRRLAGYVVEETIAGAGLLRIDIYAGDEPEATVTQYYAPSALYCLTPTTEKLARQFGKTCTPQPVRRYELPSPDDDLEPERDF